MSAITGPDIFSDTGRTPATIISEAQTLGIVFIMAGGIVDQ